MSTKEDELYSEIYQEPLKDFKQESDMIDMSCIL